MRVQLQPAYVLHTRAYRDTSLLVDLFTAELGRFSAVARGVRGAKRSSRAAQLQPFRPLLASFSGRGELKTLGSVEQAGRGWHLQGQRLYSGLYVNELLIHLLHRNDPHPRLFAAYGDVIGRLADDASVETALRRFELLLLDELGYHLMLAEDADGDVILPESLYLYVPERGLVLQRDRQGKGYPGAHLMAMAGDDFAGPVTRTAKSLLREVLAQHLGGATLHSRELFLRAAVPD